MNPTYVPSLSREQSIEALVQTHSIWGGSLSVADRIVRQLKRLERAGPELYVMSGLIGEDGELLCSMKRYYFPLAIEGVPIKAVGLGAIFTKSEKRRSGLAATLIEHALNESSETLGCAAAILYSDIDMSYYRKFGFAQTPAANWSLPIASLPSAVPFEVREAVEADLEGIISLYDRHTSNHQIRTLRSASTWRLFHDMNGVGPTQILLNEGEPIGYLSSSIDGTQLWVDEICCPLSEAVRGWATLRALARDENVTNVQGWFTPNCQEMKTLVGFELRPRSKAVPMVKGLSGRCPDLSPMMLSNAYFPPPDHF